MDLKKRMLRLLPYAIVLALGYYVVPALIRDTGSAMFVLLLAIPLLTLACGVVFGVRHGFELLLSITAAALFIPSIFLFYNDSAWVYTIGYGAIALAGNGIGKIFHWKR